MHTMPFTEYEPNNSGIISVVSAKTMIKLKKKKAFPISD
jgi:hypothetical protein